MPGCSGRRDFRGSEVIKSHQSITQVIILASDVYLDVGFESY